MEKENPRGKQEPALRQGKAKAFVFISSEKTPRPLCGKNTIFNGKENKKK
ncbi:MAG: hypothetical protein WCG32_02400 [Actinomycetes bacterium]